MGWRLDLILKLTPLACAAQHVYYCGNRNGSERFNATCVSCIELLLVGLSPSAFGRLLISVNVTDHIQLEKSTQTISFVIFSTQCLKHLQKKILFYTLTITWGIEHWKESLVKTTLSLPEIFNLSQFHLSQTDNNVFGEKLWANLGSTTEILIPFSNCIPV